jgi:L-methionine (R)-S-oxide reductase
LSERPAFLSAVKQIAAMSPQFDWVGIYLLRDDVLELGPFVGAPTEHTRSDVYERT